MRKKTKKLSLYWFWWNLRPCLRYGLMVKVLACRMEGPRFESRHGKSFGKFQLKSFGKKASYPLLAWWKSGWWECSPTHKKAGVCAIMSIWLVHIKEHVWTIGTCPTTILLSAVTMCECVCEWQQWRQLYQEDLSAAWGMRPVCSPGSQSGRGWLPLILAWHSQKHIIVKRSWKLMAKLTGRYIKNLTVTVSYS